MSWSALPDSHVFDALQRQSHFSPRLGPNDDDKRVATFGTVDVWELLSNGWNRRACHPNDLEPGVTRIIFAPYPSEETATILFALLRRLDIPSEFAAERPCSVSHSIGSREGQGGSMTAWFHTLTKNIHKKGDKTHPVQNIVVRGDRLLEAYPSAVPGTDETWLQSGYCLSVPPGARSPTLVCFGATRNVIEKLKVFRQTCYAGSRAEKEIEAEPLALLDLVIYGSFGDIDERVWRMCDNVYQTEKNILLDAWQAPSATDSQRDNFAVLHNWSKQVIHLRETVDGFILVVDNLREIVLTRKPESDEAAEKIRKMLVDNLRHRRSLFNQLRLRLSSLQRRIDNSIGLAFNLVAQQDSMTMKRDASSMKIIAAITMMFLPTTAVASIVGSQIFTVNFSEESGTWDVQASPMFKVLWAVAGPLTVVVVAMSAGWNTLMERGNRRQSTKGS